MTMSSRWLTAASVLSFTLMLSGVAQAQSTATRTTNPDTEYCSTLVKKYNQYLNETIGQGAPATSLDGRVAIEQCSSNPKASTFVLEQKLNDAKLDLPKR